MPNLKEQIEALMPRAAELKNISGRRELTDAEFTESIRLSKTIEALEERVAKSVEIADKLKSINADAAEYSGGDGDHDNDDEDGHRIPLGGKGIKRGFLPRAKSFDRLAERIAKQVQGLGRKAIDSNTLTPIALDTTPIPMDKPAGRLLNLLPVLQRGEPRFQWLQQTVRENNAKIVAPGELKPTSHYNMETRSGKLRTLAHTSDNFDKYLLIDAPALGQFIGSELLYGLYSELERQVIAGTGDGSDTALELKGLLSTSGVRQQAFATNRLITTRKAVTQLEKIGINEGGYWVLSPDDWEELELSRTPGSGQLELGSPVNAAAKQLWSRPVVTVPGLTLGTGFFVGTNGAMNLSTDLQGVETLWFNQHEDNAARNLLFARCEGRFELEVTLPGHIVNLALAA